MWAGLVDLGSPIDDNPDHDMARTLQAHRTVVVRCLMTLGEAVFELKSHDVAPA